MDTPGCYCEECGAANPYTATTCFSCARLLEVCATDQHPDNETRAQTVSKAQVADAPVYMQITLSAHAQTTVQLIQPAPPARSTTPLLQGRYLVLGQVGTGGFGAVYKARDLQANGRMVAIKAIELDTLSASQAIEATDTFNRELGLLSSLNHPHLPAIHEHFIDETHWYLVMDFIDGEPLDEYLQQIQEPCLPLKQVLNIGVQLCDVLRYLHQLQPPVIFRDLKPANIMRTPGGRIYLIDFGIARRFKPGQTRDTTPLGSPGFAAPEQYGKAQTTPRSDIYSLGATLYFLLTGYDPSNTPFHLPPIRSLCPTLPEALAELITTMLALDPAERPTSISTVQHALNNYSPATRHTTVLAQTRAYAATHNPVAQPVTPATPAYRLKNFLKGIFSIAMTCLVVAACTLTAHFMGAGSFTQTTQGSSGQPLALLPKTFRMPYIGSLDSLDPFTTTSSQDAYLENLLFGHLVSLDNSGKTQPQSMASSWEASTDLLNWTFRVNPHATFSNTTPITATDIAASLNYALASPTAPAHCPFFSMIKNANLLQTRQDSSLSNTGIQVVDPATIVITLARPSPSFLTALTAPCGSILSKNDLSLWGGSAFTQHFPQLAFSGNYTVANFDSPNSLLLVYTSDNSYQPVQASNTPEEIIVQSYSDAESSYAAYKKGLLDMSPSLAYAPPGDKTLRETYARTLHYYGMNYLAKPFDNLAIRQAFALAIDKTSFAGSPWSYPSVSLLGSWQYPATSYQFGNPVTGQPVRAKRLLTQGLKQEGLNSISELPPISLAYQEGLPGIENEVTMASSMWHTVLGVTITPQPLKDLNQALAATRGNASLQFWVSDYTQATLDTYATIGLPFAQGSPFNSVNYGQNSSSDAAKQQALQLKLASQIPGIQTNEEMDRRADQQLSEEVAWLPVYRIYTPYFFSGKLAPPFSSEWSPWISLDYCLWSSPGC